MSVRKKPTEGRSGKVAVEASGSAQSAAARKSAEAELNALIAKYTPTQIRLTSAMRKALQKRLPTANEVVYEYENLGAVVISYSPSEQGYEGVLAIRGSAEGVKLYFNQGKDLPDPEKLLKGSSQTRFIDVEGASTLARPPVARLIEEAIAHNRVPFASEGRGAVIIRSTAAKKPRAAKSVRSANAGSPTSKTQKSKATKKK
jgi:hypothetical protein